MQHNTPKRVKAYGMRSLLFVLVFGLIFLQHWFRHSVQPEHVHEDMILVTVSIQSSLQYGAFLTM